MYFALDIGGTFVKYAVMDGEAGIIEKGKFPTPNGPGCTAGELTDRIGDVFDKCREHHDFAGVAVSLPGMIDVENGIVYEGGALTYMDGVPFGRLLSERCGGLPVVLENDAKCAALAEIWKGNAVGARSAVLFIFGTGIGGAVVLDGKVVHGKNLSAGEFSYLLLQNLQREDIPEMLSMWRQPPLSMDEQFEGPAFHLTSRLSAAGICYRVAKRKGLAFAEVDGHRIYRWVDKGDRDVIEVLEDVYFEIARECCNLQFIFDPDVILIGGGISAEPRFVEGIQRYAKELQGFTRALRGLDIRVCKFKNDANLVGALRNFLTLYPWHSNLED